MQFFSAIIMIGETCFFAIACVSAKEGVRKAELTKMRLKTVLAFGSGSVDSGNMCVSITFVVRFFIHVLGVS